MLKKVLGILLVIILLTAGFSNCGESKGSKKLEDDKEVKQEQERMVEREETERKQSQFDGLTYEEEKKTEEIVLASITIPEGSERTRYEMFKNDLGITCKIVYSITDNHGVIHDHDYCLVINSTDWSVVSNNYEEKLLLEDYAFTIYKDSCKSLIKKNLKAPSTAEFPGFFHQDEWTYGFTENGNLIIQSWVDSQNGFGAMIRSTFQIEVDFTTDTMRIIYLQ